MALSVLVKDRVEGSSYWNDTQGEHDIRIWIIGGIPDAFGPGAARAACQFSEVPVVSQSHPRIPLIVLHKKSVVETLSRSAVAVALEYHPADAEGTQTEVSETAQPRLRVSSALQPVTTNFDIDGNPIKLTFTPALQEGEVGPPTPLTQLAQVQLMRPVQVLDYERREPNDPRGKAAFHLGTVNDRDFRGLPAGCWLVTRLDGSTDDGGASFTVVYQLMTNVLFDRDPQGNRIIRGGWNPDVIFTVDGEPVSEPNLETGSLIKGVKMYNQSNFALMGNIH